MAGQFVSIAVPIGESTHERSYSISSLAPEDPWLRITVKRVTGGRVSNWLIDEAQVGTELDLAVPRGRFFVAPSAPVHAILLGAGSGMVPLVPIARRLAASGRHRVTLACGQRTSADVMLADELKALAERDACEVHLRLSRPAADWAGERGRIDGPWITDQLARWRACGLPLVIYLCGPDDFMREAESALLMGGVCEDEIRKESFALTAQDDDGQPGLIVQGGQAAPAGTCERLVVTVNRETHQCTPLPGDASVLAALLRIGVDIPYSCQEGTCASCMGKVLRGSVDLRPAALEVLRKQDIEDGIVLACLARPTSSLVHIDFDNI